MTSCCIDTNVVILLLSGTTSNITSLRAAIEQPQRAIASVVALAECLVLPLRQQRTDEADRIRTFFTKRSLELVPVRPEIAERAAAIRGRFNLPLIDSLHLATSLEARADSFITTDKHFERCVGKVPITIVRLEP